MARNISEEEFKGMHAKLVEMMRNDNYAPQVIIGIAKGGMELHSKIVREFNNAKVMTAHLKLYDDENKPAKSVKEEMPFHAEDLDAYSEILIVDDVVHTGHTVSYLTSRIKKGKNVRVAALFYKPKTSSMKPDYYVEETDEWIVFPWESKSS